MSILLTSIKAPQRRTSTAMFPPGAHAAMSMTTHSTWKSSAEAAQRSDRSASSSGSSRRLTGDTESIVSEGACSDGKISSPGMAARD